MATIPFSIASTVAAIVALLLLWAAVVDWRRREIPDTATIAIAVLALPYWWATHVSLWPGVAIQLAVAVVAFAVFAGVWALRQMGGGDVKLLVALALLLPPADFMAMLFVMAIAGGVLTVVMIVDHRRRASADAFENPYGIAIAFAALWVLAERYLNHLG